MLFEFTQEEKDEAQAIEDAYEQLLQEKEKELNSLRPDPEPDYDRIDKIQKKINALKVPKGYEYDPDSPEAKKYQAAYQRLNKQIDDIIDAWDEAGSQEWHDARVAYNRVHRERDEARTAFYHRAEERYADSLGDVEAVYREAVRQIRPLIEVVYHEYEAKLEGEYLSFRSYDVRLQEDGGFMLDTTETAKRIESALDPLVRRLKADDTYYMRYREHLRAALATSPYVSSTGELWGEVKRRPQSKVPVRPDKHVTTLTRVAEKTFKSELMRPLEADKDALWSVRLDARGNVTARVAIDYASLVESGVFTQLPKLSGDDMDVHDAIITLWYFGNRVMTYDMIYRAMSGKVDGKIRVSDDIYAQIDQALAKFNGRVIIKASTLDEKKNETTFEADENIIYFRRVSKTINGKRVEKAIEVLDEPVFLRWAKANRNELDTRDIKLLDVPNLNNGKESAAIRRILYRRIVKMRRDFEASKKPSTELPVSRRRIRYDYLYGELGLDDPDKNKRRLIKDKVDRILDYWAAEKLIAGYEHVKDETRTFFAIDLRFVETTAKQATKTS